MSVFVDTNVLVYAVDPASSEKHARARSWLDHVAVHESGRISYQVLQEYYVTVTRKLAHPMDPADAREDVRDLLGWDPVSVDASLLEGAWREQEVYGFSFWDALIVAAARAQGCERLLTEDLQAGQDLGGLSVVDPFGTAPPGDQQPV